MALLRTAGAQALAIYKCEAFSMVTYSDTPCINGKTIVFSEATVPTAVSGI
jgi:hypothetical protein